ncbi:hypothetical protein FPZ72_08550 [Campylobacter jejuni]|uniref:Uncharacterized protein n=2 Tax=Campylobacter jejuni TaxID=197 RepID=A0A5T0JX28_CAMJU|nr:hypothetical protein [Campylobacter coli]EAC1603787.1 hypothetical protein [Campylobacter jejuni]EAQ71739.1 hypothetical protein CJJ81176_pVir0050 [Campylobacter jejuni subsp. jejuni 81-176]ETN89817.1 hypothetical protein X910_08980 [Campylobacter jejuni subsp. jejuni 81-176-UMCW9]EAH4527297.1 hypothetical protein [Campylobacter jejuni]
MFKIFFLSKKATIKTPQNVGIIFFFIFSKKYKKINIEYFIFSLFLKLFYSKNIFLIKNHFLKFIIKSLIDFFFSYYDYLFYH